MKNQGVRQEAGWTSIAVVAAGLLALLAMIAGCSGCLWLAVPSLAYEGYKYESGNHQSTQQSTQAKPRDSSQPPGQNDIE